jgi:hypothetical protein
MAPLPPSAAASASASDASCSCLGRPTWVASCTGCGAEGHYFVKNRLNPRGRRHTSHFVEGNDIKACGQFKRKPRMGPFVPPPGFFPDQAGEGGELRGGGRVVDSLSVGMFVVYTGNDEEERVGRVCYYVTAAALLPLLLCCAVMCCVVLCSVVLCSVVLCCAVLCCDGGCSILLLFGNHCVCVADRVAPSPPLCR